MSIPKEWHDSFPGLPARFVEELFAAFSDQVDAWYMHDWEKIGLKAGKICEISYSIIEGIGSGKFASQPFKPQNFLSASTQIESKYAQLPRALRIQIPRILVGMYELRNNRSVGHVGSAVQPNHLDGEYFFRASKWVICELSRAICEAAGRSGAEGFYAAVNSTELPLIWEHGDIVRVLRPELSYADKVIVILAHFGRWMPVKQLYQHVEYKRTDFKTRILSKLHGAKLLEFDVKGDRALILPAGVRRARGLHT